MVMLASLQASGPIYEQAQFAVHAELHSMCLCLFVGGGLFGRAADFKETQNDKIIQERQGRSVSTRRSWFRGPSNPSGQP
jgi:hypothetical protein